MTHNKNTIIYGKSFFKGEAVNTKNDVIELFFQLFNLQEKHNLLTKTYLILLI